MGVSGQRHAPAYLANFLAEFNIGELCEKIAELFQFPFRSDTFNDHFT
jgi:hypothetical protein